MDNTEVHYLTYDPDAIFREMQLAYAEASGEVLYPGDEREMLLRAAQAVIVQCFAGVDNALRMATLRYAVGDYLDVYGENRGCRRITEERAKGKVTLELPYTGRTAIIPAGTLMTADGEHLYRLIYDVTHAGIAQNITADMEAAEAGSAGNGLAAGAQLQIMTGGLNITRAICSEAPTGGTDREGDDAYRERIRQFGLQNLTTGPRQQYEAVAKAVSSQIIDARAWKLQAGRVGVVILTENGANMDSLIRQVQDALNDDTVRPLTDQVIVDKAIALAYRLDVQYTTDSSRDISASVAAAVTGYQNWQDKKIGRDFNPDRLTAALYEAGCSRVMYKSTSQFNGGPVAYTKLNVNNFCSGSITTEVIAE